jgi:hypothetical protein
VGRRLALVALIALVSCSKPEGTQPFPGMCGPLQALTWEPKAFAQQVPRDAVIRITFDDYPDPDTVGAADFLLTTGVYWHTGVYGVDLIDKSIWFRAANPLRAELGYTVTVMPPLLSLQGCPTILAQRTFHTASALAMPAEPPAVAFSDVQPILKRSCGGAGCHRAAPEEGGACLDAPAAGLSLCDRDAVDALVGVPSRQVSRLQLVEPRKAARSYLLRKLLPASDGGDGPAPTALGHRDPPGAPLPEADLRTIARWIDVGAPR